MGEQYENLTDSERTERMASLRAELNAHPGPSAVRAWNELSRSQAIVSANAQELLVVLRAPNQNTDLALELIQNVRPPIVRDQYFLQLDQRLHNLLASVVTLVDHRRRTFSSYDGSAFGAEFDMRNAQVLAMPETAFVRDFRNYLLHYGHAPMSTSVSLNHSGTTTRLTVSTEALLASSYVWKTGARRLLESTVDGLELEPTIVVYLEALEGLDRWCEEQFEELHGVEVAEANDLVRRINLTLSGGITDGHDWVDRMAHVAENSERLRRGEPQTDYDSARQPPGAGQ